MVNILSDSIIKIGEFMYRIYPYNKNDELEYGNAYTFEGKVGNGSIVITYPYVFPYMGQWSKKCIDVGIYSDKNGKHKIIYPKNDKERAIYNISRIFHITPETIKTELDKYLTEATMEELKSSGNKFEPVIKETDDFGIKAVRLFLTAKNFELSPYLNKLEKNWDKANIRKALEKDSSLTFSKLIQYSELFEFGLGLIMFDREGAKDPISKDGKAIVVFNDEYYDIDAGKLEVITNVEDLENLKE